MPGIAIYGSIGVGVCSCHDSPRDESGTVMATFPLMTVGNQSVARMYDIVVASCGHVGIIISGSITVTAGNIGLARVNDNFVGCFTGIIVTGALSTSTP